MDFTETPCPHNPLGVKGAGETATVPAAVAISNAIHNALGANNIDMPLTPEKIWKFMQEGNADR
jgi:carbon-monoxide dehydrogenase large subunit